MAEVAVKLDGFAEIQRGLREVDKGLPRELSKVMGEGAERTVLPRARSDAPHLAGALAGSLKVVAQQTTVSIRSALPYAAVQHWGGTTGKGHRPGVGGSGSVRIRPNAFVLRAGEETMDRFAQELSDALDGFFARHGF